MSTNCPYYGQRHIDKIVKDRERENISVRSLQCVASYVNFVGRIEQRSVLNIYIHKYIYIWCLSMTTTCLCVCHCFGVILQSFKPCLFLNCESILKPPSWLRNPSAVIAPSGDCQQFLTTTNLDEIYIHTYSITSIIWQWPHISYLYIIILWIFHLYVNYICVYICIHECIYVYVYVCVHVFKGNVLLFVILNKWNW